MTNTKMDFGSTTSNDQNGQPSVYSNKGFTETEVEFCSPNLESNTTLNFEKKKDAKEIKYGVPGFWHQLIAALTSSMVHFGIGVVVGYTGITLPSMMDQNSEDFILTKDEASIFTSVISVGALVGSLISGLISTWIGQRLSLLICLPIGIAAWLSLSFSVSFWFLIISRIIQGIIIGVITSCAINYTLEIAHPTIRGRLVGLNDLFRQIGFLYLCLIGSTDLSWRSVGLICGVSSYVIPFIGFIFLPNSPRWLATRGRYEEATKSLTFFRGSDYDVDLEISDIIKQLRNNETGGNLLDQLKMLGNNKIFKIFVILSILLFASNFTGNFVVITYGVTIFQMSNVSINAYFSIIITTVTRVVGAILYILFSDRLGRKPSYMVPLFLSGACMISLGTFFYLKSISKDLSNIQWLPLASIMLFTIFFCLSSPILKLLRSELMPTEVRSLAVGILYAIFFSGSFSVSYSYPYMVDSIGSHWTFWIYGTISFVMFIVTAICIPETRGKSLEEIAGKFTKNDDTS